MDRRVVLARVNTAIANGLSVSRIGYLTIGDPAFVKKLRDGHAFRPSTLWRAYEELCIIDKPRRVRGAARQRKSRR